MKLQFVEPSEQELKDAFDFYENQLEGLGDRFLIELNKSIKIILERPLAWSKIGNRTRRALLKKFPYLILYIHENDTIFITGIAHQHRNPDYYVDRLI
jgi:plasmid stabilization system protein ParE